MKNNLRADIIKAVIRVENGSYSSILLDSILNAISDKRDKALFTEIYYGVIRNKLYLDHVINTFSNTALKKMDIEVLMGLRIGIYQLLFLDRVPNRAAVYESVEAVKSLLKHNSRGAASFVNGVLRSAARYPEKIKLPDPKKDIIEHLSIKFSYPKWIIKMFIEEYNIDKTKKILEAGNKRADVVYRHNSLKMNRKKFLKLMQDENIAYQNSFLDGFYRLKKINNPAETEVFKSGGAYIQGTSAGLAALLLDLEENMSVLDLAAAPGGKTTHIADIMNNTGNITALDKNPSRLNLIKENADRLGVNNIELKEADAAEYEDDKKYDRILADLPCSGLSLISSKPEIKFQKNKKTVKTMSELQYSILINNLDKLKVGGKLLYSTCTLTRAENQNIVERIINENDDLFLEDLHGKFKEITSIELDSKELKHLELLPGLIDSEGFFYALIKKH